jgi:AraC-like DNA-binding protein
LLLIPVTASCIYHLKPTIDIYPMNPADSSLHVQKACAYINAHFSEPLNLNKVCAVVGISPAYLVVLFQKELRITPMRYVWQFRLEKAAELLVQTGYSISQVGYRIGFQSNFHFSRLFKQHYQLTPKEFRKMRATASV